jgi:hypothetical protein
VLDYITGIVHDVRPGVTRFEIGDLVLTVTASLWKYWAFHGTHPRYSLSDAAWAAKVRVLLQ